MKLTTILSLLLVPSGIFLVGYSIFFKLDELSQLIIFMVGVIAFSAGLANLLLEAKKL